MIFFPLVISLFGLSDKEYTPRPTFSVQYVYASDGSAASDPPRQDFECAEVGPASSYLFHGVAVTVGAIGGEAVIVDGTPLGKALTCEAACYSEECYTTVKFRAARARFYGTDWTAKCYLQGAYSSPHFLSPAIYGFDYWIQDSTNSRLYPVDVFCEVEGTFEMAAE